MHDGVGKMSKNEAVFHELNGRISADTIMLFDLDGTLVDTNLANYLSYSQAIREITNREHDVKFNNKKRFNRADLKTTITNLDESQIKNIISLKAEIYKNFLSKTRLNYEIAALLVGYSMTNKTVLVTGSEEDRAMLTLRYHGIGDYFKHFIFHNNSNEKVATNKYDAAIAQLGLNPKSIIAFENEDADIECAVQARIPRRNILVIRAEDKEEGVPECTNLLLRVMRT